MDESRRRFTSAAAVAAAVAFLGVWALVHTDPYTDYEITDIPVYAEYGERMEAGALPYRDFAVEYPPGALPVFVAPALVSDDEAGFRRAFEVVMAAAGLASVLLAGLILARLGAARPRVVWALAVATLFPLALGPVLLTRFDLLPAALVAGAVAAVVAGRPRLGLGILGAAIAVKLYPAVLLPLALAYVRARHGGRAALVSLGVAAAVAAAVVLPFFLLSPGGFLDSIGHQLSRPLQIESLGASLFLAAHHLAGVEVTMRPGHGSQNLAGTGPAVTALVATAVQLAAFVWIWSRRPATAEELVRWSAAALVAFVALGKVLSPQFLIWLVPLVPLVRGRRGLYASAVLLLAMALTHAWFPSRYWALALEFDPFASWLVVARDLLLVVLFALLVWPARRRDHEAAPEASRPRHGGRG